MRAPSDGRAVGRAILVSAVSAGLLVTACAAIVGIKPESGATSDGGLCATDSILCDGGWVDPLTSAANCGGCAMPCPETCVAGHCLATVEEDGGDPAASLLSLGPGLALVLDDGTYGPLHIDCSANGGNANNGEMGHPIVISAAHERQAILQSDGSESALSIANCSYYVIDGLTVTSQNNAAFDAGEGGSDPPTVSVTNGTSIELRRLLVAGNNGNIPGTPAVNIATVMGMHIVESEIYDFNADGLKLSGKGSAEVERLYVNPRSAGGTQGIECMGCGVTIENSVVEAVPVGFDTYPFGPCQDVQILGSIALGSAQSLIAGGCNGSVVQDFAAIHGAGDAGLFSVNVGQPSTGTAPVTVANVTMFDTGGLKLGNGGGTAVNVDWASGQVGVNVSGGWDIESSNILPHLISPADACADLQCGYTDPGLDSPQACLAYVAPGSPMFDAGQDGTPLGADIRTVYTDGGKTDTPLWCGGFPCGATYPGINDQDTGTCRTLAARLNFVEGGCPFPAP